MISPSAWRAWSSARSAVSSRYALSCGSSASVRRISAVVSSTGESRFCSISRAASAIVRNASSSAIPFAPLLGRRGDREAADHVVALDQARDEPGFLRLLDKVAQKGGAGGIASRRADRLLHGGELPVENARTGQFLQIRQQPRPQPGERVHLVVDELLECSPAAALRTDHLGMLDVAREPQIISAARADRDAH